MIRAWVGLSVVVTLCVGCAKAPTPEDSPRVAPPAPPVSASDRASVKESLNGVQMRLEELGVPVTLSAVFLDAEAPLLRARHDQLPKSRPLEALLAPVREQIVPLLSGCAGTCVVFVPRLTAPSSAATSLLPELEGLTLGPRAWGVAGLDDEARARLLRALGWPEGRVAILIDGQRWRRRGAEERRRLLLHELGHSLGLAHGDSGPMATSPGRQVGDFSAGERETLRRLGAAMRREQRR